MFIHIFIIPITPVFNFPSSIICDFKKKSQKYKNEEKSKSQNRMKKHIKKE